MTRVRAKPAARLYGFSFEGAPHDYTIWYNALSSWIRSHFAKKPLAQLDGYIGSAALAWFKEGGLLVSWPGMPMS